MRCRSRHESLPHNRTVSSFKDLKDAIIKDYKKEAGTRKYFDLIDDVSEMNFTKKYRLQELADRFNLKIVSSKYISKDEGHGIFDYAFVRKNKNATKKRENQRKASRGAINV